MATVLAASLGGLAGCGSGDGGGTATSEDTDGGMDPTETDDPGTVGTTDDGTPTQTDSPTPTGPPQRETLRHYMATNPSSSNANIHATSSNAKGVQWMQEMIRPFKEGQSRYYPSGTTWDLPDLGEVEVMSWISDTEIEAPFDWWETYDERAQYWDGTALDAEPELLDRDLRYYAEPNAGEWEPGSKNHERTGEFEMHRWQSKGEAEGTTASPSNQFALELAIGRYNPPLHPSLVRPWVQEARDASSAEEAEAVWTDQVEPYVLTYSEMAREGYGSGLYKAVDESAVTDQGITLTARSSDNDTGRDWTHPNYREQTVDEINLQVADGNLQETLAVEGEIDINLGAISESQGAVNRETLPPYIQQLGRSRANASFGFTTNWRSHLGNLWVRRAVVEAVDWEAVSANATGPQGYYPNNLHVGMKDQLAETWLPDEVRNNLIEYSFNADTETATEYMQNAGYSQQGGSWVSPDGDEAEIQVKASPGFASMYQMASRAFQEQLNNFGFTVTYESLSTQAANTARDNMSYDAMHWWNNQRTPWEAYTASSGNWAAKFVERDPEFPNSVDGWDGNLGGRTPDPETIENEDGEVTQTHDDYDLRNQPLHQQIPTEVGTMEAPDEAGDQPDLQGAGIDAKEIDITELLYEFQTDPELSQDRATEIMSDLAWYHNYYVPDFWHMIEATGVWGNVRDFDFVENDHEVYTATVKTGGYLDNYQTHSGLVSYKYDDEFPDP